MKSSQVKIGGVYLAKVSGKKKHIKILEVAGKGMRGWNTISLTSGRHIHIRSARRLRMEISAPAARASDLKLDLTNTPSTPLEIKEGTRVCYTGETLGDSYKGNVGTVVKVLGGKRAGSAIVALKRWGKVEKRCIKMSDLTTMAELKATLQKRQASEATALNSEARKGRKAERLQKKAKAIIPTGEGMIAIKKLLKLLADADAKAGRKIRRQLRALGHRGGLRTE